LCASILADVVALHANYEIIFALQKNVCEEQKRCGCRRISRCAIDAPTSRQLDEQKWRAHYAKKGSIVP